MAAALLERETLDGEDVALIMKGEPLPDPKIEPEPISKPEPETATDEGPDDPVGSGPEPVGTAQPDTAPDIAADTATATDAPETGGDEDREERDPPGGGAS
jgi:hypothetical protein